MNIVYAKCMFLLKKNSSKFLVFVLLFSVTSILVSGCKKEEEPKISDEDFYEQIAYAVLECHKDIYNQNIAGTPVGTTNVTASGPMGGTVTVTGNSGEGEGMTTLDLVYSMTEVEYVKSSYGYNTVITISGATAETGSFSSSYQSINYQSSSLHITGSVTGDGTTRQIDMTGSISINRTHTSVTANIFGNLVSW